MGKVFLALALALAISPLVFFSLWPRSLISAAPAATHEELARRDGIPYLGPQSSSLEVTVFTDYRCQHCKRLHESLQTLRAELPGLKVLHRHWPILGDESVACARLAIAADLLRQYDGADAAMAKLSKQSSSLDRDGLLQEAGFDVPRLKAVAARHQRDIDQRLAANKALAKALGLQGTPAIVIGGQLIEGAPTLATLRQMLVRPAQAP
ncbi:MAG: hypothetical protein EKK53_03170 [Burkholderiales bacterium]|nr:MAG: hypothetical protein EKK53_03170 [Burkholderiales bacterium]